MFKYGNLHEPHIKHNKEPNIKSLFLFIVLWICSQHFQSPFLPAVLLFPVENKEAKPYVFKAVYHFGFMGWMN
jgi:hypothetical protein